MNWPGHRNHTPIGVDLGARQIKAMQLGPSRNGWRVRAAASFARPGLSDQIDPRAVRQLDDVLYRRGFRGRDIVLAVPGDRLLSSVLELPAAGPGVPLEQIARMEMARLHKLEPRSFEMACWALPAPDRAAKKTHMMACACAHRDADPIVDAFADQGLNVCALGTEADALARAGAPASQDAAGVVSILDLGWHAARLVVVHDNVITYERTLNEAGLEALHQRLHKQFDDDEVAEHMLRKVGLAPADADEPEPPTHADVRRTITGHFEAMLNELLASLSYMSRQYPQVSLAGLSLVGAGAAVPGLAEYLETMLDVSVRPLAPADLVDCPEALLDTCRNPMMTTALGLALFSDGT